MMTHEAPESRTTARHPGIHRLLPVAGITAAIVAVLAHLGGSAALMHFGLGAGLAYLGVDVANLGGGALAIGIVAVVAIKLLVVFGAARLWRNRDG